MKILFYLNSSMNNNVLVKDLTYSGQADINLLDETDVLAPQVIISQVVPDGINYCYIQQFDRFYYCKPVIINRAQTRLMCSVDPLSSTNIETLTVAVKRTSDPNYYDKEIDDSNNDLILPQEDVEMSVHQTNLDMSAGSFVVSAFSK